MEADDGREPRRRLRMEAAQIRRDDGRGSEKSWRAGADGWKAGRDGRTAQQRRDDAKEN
jgi:hypothetical protein